VPVDFHFFKARRPQQEGPFDSDPIAGDPSDCKIGVIAAASQPDNRASEFLGPFICAFFYADVYPHHVSRPQFGDVWIWGCFNGFYYFFHNFVLFSGSPKIIFKRSSGRSDIQNKSALPGAARYYTMPIYL
jgi:hypothetical protein